MSNQPTTTDDLEDADIREFIEWTQTLDDESRRRVGTIVFYMLIIGLMFLGCITAIIYILIKFAAAALGYII